MLARKLRGRVTKDRRLEVVVPEDVEPGVVEIILLSEDVRRRPARRHAPEPVPGHPAFGIWADRTDIQDSWTYAVSLRQRIETRRDREPLT
jgi:hypothetical protein